jgi:hypothetical protein
VAVDHREQLCNSGEIGPIEQVSLPLAAITSLRGILLDFDPDRFRRELLPYGGLASPDKFFVQLIRNMLAHHEVLNKAEVRSSGRGLHVIIRFRAPIEFPTEAERSRWAAIVKVIQRLLPTDPDCPGITALTRPLGSINSKNGATVRRLRKGVPVPADEVLALFEVARTSPFRTLAKILFGSDRVTPCPVCRGDDSRLDALDGQGRCYGHCGKVQLGRLFDVFLESRPAKPK